jgi:hypothetical protein
MNVTVSIKTMVIMPPFCIYFSFVCDGALSKTVVFAGGEMIKLERQMKLFA